MVAADVDGNSCDVRVIGARVEVTVPAAPALQLCLHNVDRGAHVGEPVRSYSVTLWTVDGAAVTKENAIQCVVPPVWNKTAPGDSIFEQGTLARGYTSLRI